MKGAAEREPMPRLSEGGWSVAFAVLVMSVPMSSGQVEAPEEQWSTVGGHLVLMEQYTATWCDVCASVDVWMPEFTRANAGRVVRVAVHDTFDDPLGTPITSHRAQYHSSVPSAPTFWFDGDAMLVGSQDKATLHRELLSSEGKRSDDTMMSLVVRALSEDSISISVDIIDSPPQEGHLSIFVLRDSVIIDPDRATNGIIKHHDVAIAYAETSLIGDSKWSYPEESWDDASAAGYVTQSGDSVLVTHTFVVPDKVRIEGLRVVAVHETSTSEDNGPSTLGAVSVFLGEQENSAGTGLLIPLSFILALSTLAITTRSRR